MSEDPASGPSESSTRGTADGPTPDTTLNAVVGGVVAVATALFVPLSPLLKVGVLAGVVASAPLLLVVLLVAAVVPVFGLPNGAVAVLLLGVLAFLVIGAYTVGFSALGGVLGAYLEREL